MLQPRAHRTLSLVVISWGLVLPSGGNFLFHGGGCSSTRRRSILCPADTLCCQNVSSASAALLRSQAQGREEASDFLSNEPRKSICTTLDSVCTDRCARCTALAPIAGVRPTKCCLRARYIGKDVQATGFGGESIGSKADQQQGLKQRTGAQHSRARHTNPAVPKPRRPVIIT